MTRKARTRVSVAPRRETRTLTARVDAANYDLVLAAARVRGCGYGKIVEAGSVREAQRILEVATKTIQRNRARDRQRRRGAKQ